MNLQKMLKRVTFLECNQAKPMPFYNVDKVPLNQFFALKSDMLLA